MKFKTEYTSKDILTLQEIQDIEYEILCSIVDFFEFNNIKYILAGGTMLGAVRHNGFIPWDDDIDLLVPREDYEKLKLLKSEFNNDDILLMTPGTEGYISPYIKAVNVHTKIIDKNLSDRYESKIWIDIFPLDHFPRSRFLHQTYLYYNKFLRTVLYTEMKKNGPEHGGRLLSSVFRIIYKLMGGYKKVAIKIDNAGKRNNWIFKNSPYYGDGTWPENMKDYFYEDMIFPTIMHRFRDREFSIPLNYDSYLTRFYGDYMTPPPENKRARHEFTAFWIK